MSKEDLRTQKTKKAMYKVMSDGIVIIIAKDKNGLPIVIKEKI